METIIIEVAKLGIVPLVVAALLYLNWQHQKQMGERLTTMECKLMDIVQNNTTAMGGLGVAVDKLRDCFRDKPCLLNDAEINERLRRTLK